MLTLSNWTRWGTFSPFAGAASASDLQWQPCSDLPRAECALLDVPLDHGADDSRSVSLPVRRLPAADPGQRLGVLVTIAGGRGQRGTDWVTPETLSPAIATRFDIVSFDPRGTSGETPEEAPAEETAPDRPLGAARAQLHENYIVAQTAVAIDDTDTAVDLHGKLNRASAELLQQTLPSLRAGTVQRKAQDHSQSTYFCGRSPADGEID